MSFMFSYSEISGSKSELLKLSESMSNKEMDVAKLDKPIAKDVSDINVKRCPIEGNNGHWDGVRGNSLWCPDRDVVPKVYNPDGKTFGELLDKYGVDGIPFKDREPDFSTISRGSTEIDNFTDSRYGKGGNFDQASEKLAQQRGCTKEEVSEWMKNNRYTWHECSDCKTMMKVPLEIHGNIPHSGGISAIKSQS